MQALIDRIFPPCIIICFHFQHFQTVHGYDIKLTDGTVKLIAFGAAKAGLRARREVDDTEPWVDLSALAKTLYEAMTGQAVFQDAIQPNPNVPQPLFHLFWRMIDQSGAQGIASVFDYRHALACIDLPAEYPLVSEQEAHLPIPDARLIAPQAKRPVAEPQPQLEPKRNLFARALDAMEDAVTAEKPEQPTSAPEIEAFFL